MLAAMRPALNLMDEQTFQVKLRRAAITTTSTNKFPQTPDSLSSPRTSLTFHSPSLSTNFFPSNINKNSNKLNESIEEFDHSARFKSMSQAELDYLMQITRVVTKDEISQGQNLVTQYFKEKEKHDKKYRLSASSFKASFKSEILGSFSAVPLTNCQIGNKSKSSFDDTSRPQSSSILFSRSQSNNNINITTPRKSSSINFVEKMVDYRINNSSTPNPDFNEKKKGNSARLERNLSSNSMVAGGAQDNNVLNTKTEILLNRRLLAHSAPVYNHNLINNNNNNKAKLTRVKRMEYYEEKKEDQSQFNTAKRVQIKEPEIVDSETTDTQLKNTHINNDEYLTTVEINKDNYQNTLKAIQAKLRQINDQENENISRNKKKNDNNNKSSSRVTSELDSEMSRNPKTIRRKRTNIVTKSMDVDKWLEVHKRSNTKMAISLIRKNVKSSSQQKQDKINKKIEEIQLNDGMNKKTNSNDDADTKGSSRSRSIRELSEATVLDKVEKRLKLQLIEKLKILRKIEAQNEFHLIKERIDNFLQDMESFKTDDNIINDYFYNYMNSKLNNKTFEESKSHTEITRYNPIKLYELELYKV
jgi:hypothetical protein